MTLKELAACADGAKIVCGKQNMQRSENLEVTGLCADTRLIKKGDGYFCLTGGKQDSHIFAPDACEKGAAFLVCERELEVSIPQIVVPDTRLAMSLMAAAFFGYPAQKLKLIGITGTNGKTTTAHLIAAILKKAGKRVGLIGTLGVFYGKKSFSPDLTTPDPIFLHSVFADMVACGVEYAVMEVSAHALHYRKVEGLTFEVGIFTNLTQDHLDFFGTKSAYAAAKRRFFEQGRCKKAVVNVDDKFGRELLKCLQNDGAVSYALENPADCFAVITSEGLSGSEFMLNLSDDLCRASLALAGRHNVSNAVAAAACGYELGICARAIAGGLKSVRAVSGRLERVATFRGAEIFVDFAHTPDGLKKSLQALKEHCKGKLYCLFGAGGDRDKTKRPLMGEAAAKLADFSFLTADNPRFEDVMDIARDIEKGYRRFSKEYAIISERKEAIFRALCALEKGDVLLVAGKGGEDTQEIMGIKYSYNDNAIVEEVIGKLSR